VEEFIFEIRPLRASFSKEFGVALLPSQYICGVLRGANAASAGSPGLALS